MRALKTVAISGALAAGLMLGGSFALADDTPPAVDPTASTGDKAMDELLAKEKEARKQCKIDICSILRGKKADGPDINCHVVQTWPKKALNDMLGRLHVSWPWSHVHCQADVKLQRATLVNAISQPKNEATFDKHTLSCVIERDDAGAEKYEFKVDFTPKVTFENGKAIKGELQWGDVDAPVLAKGVIWPITGLDNKTNMLSGQFVSMINQFLDKKCDEVKDELKLN